MASTEPEDPPHDVIGYTSGPNKSGKYLYTEGYAHTQYVRQFHLNYLKMIKKRLKEYGESNARSMIEELAKHVNERTKTRFDDDDHLEKFLLSFKEYIDPEKKHGQFIDEIFQSTTATQVGGKRGKLKRRSKKNKPKRKSKSKSNSKSRRR